MVIAVDLASVRRFWSRLDREVRFVLDVDFGAFEPSYEGLAQTSAEVRERLDTTHPENQARAEGWVHTDQGWAALLLDVGGVDDLLEWFELFNGTWSDPVEGRVLGGPRGSTAWGPGEAWQMSGYLAYGTGDLTAIDRNYRSPLWYVDPVTTRYLTDQAILWAYDRDAKHSFIREEWAVRPVDLDYGQAFVHGLEWFGGASVECVKAKPFRGRAAAFRPQGMVNYGVVDPAAGWGEQLADVRRALTWTPARTDLGMIRREPRSSLRWGDPTPPWPHVSRTEVKHARPLLSSFVPDVSGVQLLTDAHLARAHDLSEWKTTRLSGNRYIVEARDLAAWFAEPEPDPDALEQGRSDFGSMILTPETLVEHNPWRDGVLDHMKWRPFEPPVQLAIPAYARLLHP